MDNTEIRELRKSKGLTQTELAKLLNCEVYTVRRYEYGQSTPRRIYANTLEKIKAGLMDDEIAIVKNRKNENKKVEA